MEHASTLSAHTYGCERLETPCGRMHIERNGFLYAGKLLITTQRNSVIVCVALNGGNFSVRTNHTSLSGVRAVLIPPGYTHIDAGISDVAVLDVSPTDYNFRTLVRAAPRPQVWAGSRFAAIEGELDAFMTGRVHRLDAGRLHARFTGLVLDMLPPAKPVDPRVREVMRLMREQHGRPIGELAAAVNMSADWLRHLFVTEAGIPMRKYEMTLRLQAAAVHLQREISLSQVAVESGFADLAHFSKVWKLHYGFAPRRAFNGSELSIDAMQWPTCFETTPPSAETQALPARM